MMQFKYRVQAYVGLIAVAAIGLVAMVEWQVPPTSPSDFQNALVAFAVLAVASEAAFLRLAIGTSTSSVAYIPYLACLVLMGSAWTMLIAGLAMLVGETVVRRKAPVKVVFNVSKEVLAVGVAGFLYESLGAIPSLTQFGRYPVPFAVAVAAFFAINVGSTAVVIALSTDTSFRGSIHRLVGGSLFFDLLSTPLALLLAYLYTIATLVGVLIVVVPLFLVRHVHSVNLRLEEANRELLELMVKAIEARDPYTSGHSIRVSKVAGMLARQLSLPAKQIDEVETAALLHDVGKIHEQYAAILQKDARLTDAERDLMQTHSFKSYELVRTISSFRNGLDLAVLHHHENFDGSGYPDGLRGDDIPLASRIIMVADTTDAMTTDRPYRVALQFDQVVAELHKYSGTQFDPAVVDAFIRNESIQRFVDGERGSKRVPSGGLRASSPGVAYVG